MLGAYFWGPDRPASPPKTVTQPPRSSSWWPFGKKQGPILLEGDEGDEVPAPKKSTPGEKRTIFVAIMSRCVLASLSASSRLPIKPSPHSSFFSG